MRAARRLRMPALAAVIATALGAMTMTMAQPAAAATTCVPTMLIGVHGTGEEAGVIGNELSSLYNAVVTHTGLPEQGLQGWQDDSSLITDLATAIPIGLGQGVILGNGLFDPSALDQAVSKLQTAINAGAADLYNQVTSESAQCPGEHFVIAGFSQGASVVSQFAILHPELAGRVSGIMLWADPLFNGSDPTSRGADVAAGKHVGTAGWEGALTWYRIVRGDWTQPPAIPASWSGRLQSYCTTQDPVCNWDYDNLTDLSHHGDERMAPVLGDSEAAIDAAAGGWAPSVWDNGGTISFYSKWQSEGGVNGQLGQPSADPVSRPGGGIVQSFAGNSCGSGSAILWSPTSLMHTMDGCLYNAFMHSYGGAGGTYGYPTTDEESTVGGHGKVNHMTGTACGSTTGSGLYFSSAGTFPVHGCIYQRYESIGEDSSGLGLPTSDEYAVTGGVQQNFSNGLIRDIGGSITVTIHSNATLDNTDPYNSGCAGSAHPESTVASTTDGPTAIDLQWSGYCGTNWARVIPNISNSNHTIEQQIWVERLESNGTITYGTQFRFWPNGTAPAWSDQLYAPTLHARACENIWDIYDKQWSAPVCTAWA